MNYHLTPIEEPARLRIFRSLRSEIRSSNDYLLVGIDVAKEKHHAFFGTSSGQTLRKRFVFANNRTDFENLIALAADLESQNQLSYRVFGVEPTGIYHKPLLEYLVREAKETAVLVSNVAAKRNRELLDGRWDKNDTADSANVADMLGQGRCLFPDFPDRDLRALRNFVRARIRMKKEEHGLRMRIRNHLIGQFFPELECAYAKGAGVNDKVALRIVRQCLDPRRIAEMEFDAFWNLVAEPGWGKSQHVRMVAVWNAAKRSIGCALDDAALWEASFLTDRLTSLREHLSELEEHLKLTAYRMNGYPSVVSIPGVGPILGSMILASIGDPGRFDHPRQVLRLAGLDLCASRSGKTSHTAVPKISKQGKAALRYALVQAAMVAARSHPCVRAYFTNLLKGREQERGIKRKMYVKLASRLLVAAWTLMRRGEKFDPNKFVT